MAAELASEAVVKRAWFSPPALKRGLAEARRYPIIPLTVIMLVLIIPAISANWIAPHNPTRGDLKDRLLPPSWIGERTITKTAVVTINARNAANEVKLVDAQRQVRIGDARLVSFDGNVEQREVVAGDQVDIILQRGGIGRYLLGTDKNGRDILSRIIHGARISLIVAAIAIGIAGVIGTSLGIMAGYYGHLVDAVIMRLVDISLSIPIILMALVLVAALGASFKTIIIVLIIFLWAQYARQCRGETLTVRVQDYVARAKVSGASDARIMLRHVFPNVFNSLVVLATLQVGFVIILESTLSFLGAGIPRPTPAWGLMVADGRELIITQWWVSLVPGVAIMLTVMSMNLLGDWLRDRLDPKQRQV